MADLYMTVGDRLPLLVEQLADQFGPVNLTGMTVTFQMSRAGVNKVATAATVLSAASGLVQYAWAAADVDTPGVFFFKWQVSDGTKVWHFPSDRAKTVEFTENPA